MYIFTYFVRTCTDVTLRKREHSRLSHNVSAFRIVEIQRRDATSDSQLRYSVSRSRLLDRGPARVTLHTGTLRACTCCTRNPVFRCMGQIISLTYHMYHVCAKDLFYIQDFFRKKNWFSITRCFQTKFFSKNAVKSSDMQMSVDLFYCCSSPWVV